jgi:hypothetical protein
MTFNLVLQMNIPAVSLLLLTIDEKNDSKKMKGVDHEECSRVEGDLEQIAKELDPFGIQVLLF